MSIVYTIDYQIITYTIYTTEKTVFTVWVNIWFAVLNSVRTQGLETTDVIIGERVVLVVIHFALHQCRPMSPFNYRYGLYTKFGTHTRA